ncbi:MAG: hypothetical protein IJ089_01385 [Clostridia bacterium]|nr:hypothetical protein [Clostridia bacterium]
MEFAYSDIIGLRRPVHDGDVFSRRHPKMTQLNRAKIFAPFAALAGFDSAVRAKEIQYVPRHILDPEETYALNEKLNDLYLRTRTGVLARMNRITVKVEYFEVCADVNNDAYGRLGLYHAVTDILWKVDPVAKAITVGETIIPFGDINTLNIIGRSV